jgi:hypothetical protein
MLGRCDGRGTGWPFSWYGVTFLAGALGTAAALPICTCSSREGLLFCSLELLLVVGNWDVIVVGVTDRCGSRVVGARSSIRLGGMNCDLCDAMLGSSLV